MSTQKESRPGQGGNLTRNQAVSPILADVNDALGNLEAAVLGYCMHTQSTELLPEPQVFLPGPRQGLAALMHRMSAEGAPLDGLSVQLRISREQLGNPVFLALAEAVSAGAEVFAMTARNYLRELRSEARRRDALACIERAGQLLRGGEDRLAIDMLGGALGALGVDAA